MTAQDCLDILRSIKDVAFATVDEDGRPQVRIIDVMLTEDEKLYFCTARGKELYRQLTGEGVASGYVAITGLNSDFQMIRVSGKAERLDDQKKWIDRIFEENSSMNGVYPNESRYILEAFCVSRAQVEFFDLGKSPIVRESFVIGGADEEKKGFIITKDCIGCGKCQRACPQGCIDAGSPFVIRQENCLHCGACYEACPAAAIISRKSAGRSID